MDDPNRPRFSIISAVYDVARYLPEFIAAVEKQTFPLDRVEVVVVDDGSNDDSLEVLRRWADHAPTRVTVLHQTNGGQGSARNLGMASARGEWVTFLDPDDLIDADYLDVVDRCLVDNPDVSLVATNRIFLDDATGEVRDTHPLRRMFRDGDRVVDLELAPEHFHGSAPSAFVRLDALREHGIRFDPRIRPNFEDGEFCSRYLLAAGTSQVAFLPSARYLYRKRSDGSSTLQGSLRDRRRFDTVPRHGYLDLLRDAAVGRTYPPEWLQHFVLYELAGYFRHDSAVSESETAAVGATGHAFVQILREIANLLDPSVVAATSIAKFDPAWRDILIHLNDEQWVTPYAVTTGYDDAAELVRVAYRFRGGAPTETFVCGGEPTPPAAGKVRALQFFGETLLRERIAWVRADRSVRLLLDGSPVPLRGDWLVAGSTTLDRDTLRSSMRAGRGRRGRVGNADRVLRRLSRTRAVRRDFRDAWVLMDRVALADDNGERLFRYLRDQRPDINAWFVLARGCPAWRQLERDGYGRRLVAYGTRRWKLLMLNCRHLISSHTEQPVRRPPEILRLGGAKWTFSWLQHGVIKDDLSRWLNTKSMGVFVTSTPGEYASIVGDDTPYVFTSKEVVLSGLPRFDRLRQLADATPEHDLVLVCPTWRQWLGSTPDATGTRAVVPDFAETEYGRHWLAFLRDESLRDALAARGLRAGFLPHPTLQPILDSLDLPPWIEPLTYAGADVQQLMARSALMVTDYSSMAFNAGYIDRPVVYFQFDAERVFAGGHVGRKGYFDYERDGFGPVTSTVADAVAATIGMITAPLGSEYAQRFARTFPTRDGRCCERVVAAIEALDAPDPTVRHEHDGARTTVSPGPRTH